MINWYTPALLLAFFALLSCSPRYAVPRSYGEDASLAQAQASERGDPVLTESLFNYKDRTLSEEDIRRILDGKILLGDSLRLAVYCYSGSLARYGVWRWYDEESLKNQQQLLDTLVQALSRPARVQKVILMPVLVTGSKPNIHQLREAAVRLQADALMVYTLNSDVFQKYRVFGKDEAKAYATCETVLMDIRTGIIPHTNIVTKKAERIKGNDDLATEELQKRVLQDAALDALLDAGNKVATFLNEH